MKMLFAVFLVFLPWRLRRFALQTFFGYEIHPTARIGWSVTLVDRLEMGANAIIGHFNICKGLALLKMGESAIIGNLNWVTGHPADNKRHYTTEQNRRSEFIIERHAAITNRHLVDCSNSVHIGQFATVAGWRTQMLTHSIDLLHSRQATQPIRIGAYSLVGAGSIILSGSVLPDYSVLGAGSVLNKVYTETYTLYAGTPARMVKTFPRSMAYFNREKGAVL